MGEQVTDELSEWFRHIDRVLAERDYHRIAVDDRWCLQSDNALQWLRVEQDEDAGDPVGERFTLAGE
ncbi:hypothetical protein GCM10023217_34620 [Gordonia alkaliphila]|uniref:PH domain-containing protein n=1 Tax=Gordonia alkaliphila TaxID=1053547 RepID=A0ABP8ZKM7_9ACTN